MGKVLGIDYGEKRIGLAISSDDGRFVFPFRTIENDGSDACFFHLNAICQEEKVMRVVVGLPLDQHGLVGEKAKTVKKWGQLLHNKVGCEVLYEDERFTTVYAIRAKKQAGRSTKETRQTIDQTAAMIILQTFLDKHHG